MRCKTSRQVPYSIGKHVSGATHLQMSMLSLTSCPLKATAGTKRVRLTCLYHAGLLAKSTWTTWNLEACATPSEFLSLCLAHALVFTSLWSCSSSTAGHHQFLAARWSNTLGPVAQLASWTPATCCCLPTFCRKQSRLRCA